MVGGGVGEGEKERERGLLSRAASPRITAVVGKWTELMPLQTMKQFCKSSCSFLSSKVELKLV